MKRIRLRLLNGLLIFTLNLYVGSNTVLSQDSLHYKLKIGIKEGSIVPVPIVFYTPETTLAFGGGLINVFKTIPKDSLTSVSNIRSSLIYTLRNQILVNIDHDLFIQERSLDPKEATAPGWV